MPMAKKDNSILGKLKAMEQKALKRPKETHLAPDKHPQKDFFIADLFDTVRIRSDMKSMEHPLFALKAGDKRTRKYEYKNISIIVAPSAEYGMATIHDKDIWIYCISKLMQAKYEGKEINRIVRFTVYDYLITTNRDIGGRQYELAKNALDRLASTYISTNIETSNKREARGFGLIDSWRIVEEKDGRMVRVEVTLSEWLYRSILEGDVLPISSDYFRLRKPLDRRIYEIARKHCGNQSEWKIGLDLLLKKSGSTSKLFEFRRAIKSLSKSDELPDYHVHYDVINDMVLFKRLEKQLDIKDL